MKRLLCRMAVFALVLTGITVGTTMAASAQTTGDALVMMNGKYIDFAQDSLPRNVSGRIMVPYRAIFEYMGLEVGYDQATGTISGKTDDFTLTMKNQDPVIKLTYSDGSSSSKTMDVAPYIQGGRTFVPTRFVSEMLGCDVGWDSASKTVIIIDSSSIVADTDEDFSTLLKLQNMTSDKDSAYEVEGTVSASAQIDSMIFDVEGTVSGLSDSTGEDLDVNLSIDMGGSKDTMDGTVKVNASTGDMYMNSTGLTNTDSQWVRISMSELLNNQGIDIQDILNTANSGSSSLEDTLADMISGSVDQYDVSSYDTMKEVYSELKDLIGTDAFKKNGNTLTAKFDDTVAGTSVFGSLEIELDSEGNASSYVLDVSTTYDGSRCSVNVKSSQTTTDTVLKVINAQGSVMNFKTSITRKETTQRPDVTVPSGDTVIDLSSLLGSLF